MNNFCKLIQDIKDNPVVYLDKPSITNLRSFLDGYIFSRGCLGLNRRGYATKGFHEWMQARAKVDASHSWFGIILSLSGSEESAFYNFFDFFEEFWHQQNTLDNQNNGVEENSGGNTNEFKLSKFDFYDELLKTVKKRPGLFIGTTSITKLDMFLRGYSLARREVDAPLTEAERNFTDFQSWIEEKYNIHSGQSWAQIILSHSTDEKEALTKFFELYEEYLNQNQSLELDKSSSE